MAETSPSAPDIESLTRLLDACLLQRLNAGKWEQLATQLISQIHSRPSLSGILLDRTRLEKSLGDPLFPSYLAHALSSQLLSPNDILRSLSAAIIHLPPTQHFSRGPLLRVITKALDTWEPTLSAPHVEILWTVEKVLLQFVNPDDLGRDPSLFLEAVDAWKSLLSSEAVRSLFKTEKKKDTDQWKSFEPEVQTLAVFSSTKLPLERQTEFEGVISSFLFDITATKGPGDIGPQESELPQIPALDSRAALMILFILLRESYGLGATDEIWTVIERLAEGIDTSQIFPAIIMAAFDALAIVLKRSDMTLNPLPEPVVEVTLYQSILANRIPALLAARKESYSISAEDLAYIIVTKADPILLNLTVPAIPSLEGDEADNFPPKDYRQDFLYALVKWGLLDNEAPSQILGIELEQIVPLADARDIVRETGDVMDEQEGVERVVTMLGQFDGNQGVVVAAILEVLPLSLILSLSLVQLWTSTSNMHSLSFLCKTLMTDPSLIEQVFLHTSIPSLIEPLREFLDSWTIDEDEENEHQLIYEQYNSILFFICYCVHHFGRVNVLDDPDGPGFVRTWLREFAKAKWLDMLSDEDSNAIGTWITALFDGEGISDDLVRCILLRLYNVDSRMSPPYKWLLISTTLFQQSVSAYRQGVLPLKTLKDGFEYFTQPFLEPCLLGAMQYLASQIKIASPDNISPYLEIFSSLLVFLSPTQQEHDLFTTMAFNQKPSRILQIIGPSIFATISNLSAEQANPVKHFLDPITETLRPFALGLRPAVLGGRKEVFDMVRSTLSALANWSVGWTSGYVVPQGIDLRCLSVGVKSSGASLVIRTIVDEMWAAEETCAFHSVITAAMFLCVPLESEFGKEYLAEKLFLMMPEKEERQIPGGRSLVPLYSLVKKIMNVSEETKGVKNGDAMVVD